MIRNDPPRRYFELDTGMARTTAPTPVAISVAEVVIVASERLASETTAYLQENGVHCHSVPNAQGALRLVSSGGVDAAIVDSTAFGSDGLKVLEILRENSTLPVIILTATGRADARIRSLERGADDALSKPVSARELLARLRAILRRRHRVLQGRGLTIGCLHLDPTTNSATLGTHALQLTRVEFDLLAALARRAGRALPRSSLLGFVGRAPGVAGERSVDVHVSRLRKKVSLAPGGENLITTVRGVGYVLTAYGDADQRATRPVNPARVRGRPGRCTPADTCQV